MIILKSKSLERNILVEAVIIAIIVLCIGLLMKNDSNTLNTTSINKESISKELDGNLIGAYIQN